MYSQSKHLKNVLDDILGLTLMDVMLLRFSQDPHTTDQKRRHLRSLAELHYGKAYQLFLLLDNPCELLRVQLERVAMAEHQFASKGSTQNTHKNGLM